jgi:hypothetical protein
LKKKDAICSVSVCGDVGIRGFNKKNKKKKKILKMIAFALMTSSIYNEMAKREIIMKLLLPFFPILFGKPKYTSISRKDHANVYINVINHIPTIYANKYTVCHFANGVTNITFVLEL